MTWIDNDEYNFFFCAVFCHSCRDTLHTADKLGECVSCLGTAKTETALTGTECHHCGDMSLSSLHSRLAFFSERNPTPCTLPLFSSQGPVRKKQRDRGSQDLEMSELTPAVPPHISLSPHREFSPGLASLCGFKRSGLIRWKLWWRDGRQPVIGGFRCGGAVGLVPWPRPLAFCPTHPAQAWTPNFSWLTLWRNWVWNGLPRETIP